MSDNITFLLSLDNYVYGVLTFALEECPFNIIKRMIVECTYLHGIKTYKVFATSKDIEDIITITTNCEFKPLFLKDNTAGNVITTGYKTSVDYYIDTNKISITTQNILSTYLKQNTEDEFISFCSEFIEDFETLELIERTFESIKDADMMSQCDALLSDSNEDVVLNQ